MKQPSFPQVEEFFLAQRIAEATEVIQQAVRDSKKPLIIQFSGGRDSMVLVTLVSRVTREFECVYMISGIDFPESIIFANQRARQFDKSLLFSDPSMYKGGFFVRLERFKRFPTVMVPWCNAHLKIRPQKVMLERTFGRGTFYKLNGVRRWESLRRRYRYSDFIKPDPEHSGSFQVLPLLDWTDSDVTGYLEAEGLPSSGLYKKYGVSGCYYCPFYQTEIYLRILNQEPDLYDSFIEREEHYGPSVIHDVFLGDLKKQVSRSTRDIDKPFSAEHNNLDGR